MDAFHERLILRAATIDELLSLEFESQKFEPQEFGPSPGGNGEADLAARRIEAWRRSSVGGDPALFGRRLERDRLSFAAVQERFASVRRGASAAPPAWLADAIWIEAALQRPAEYDNPLAGHANAAGIENQTCAFEDLFTTLVTQAETKAWSGLDATASANLTETARACLRLALLREVSGLCAAAVYERFAKVRNAAAPADATTQPQDTGTARYDQFVTGMQAGGFRRLFEDKPVLLRLIASLTRQWIDTSREFVLRLASDLPAIRRDLLQSSTESPVAKIESELSDPHNGGHSVLLLTFTDGARLAYKPKDLRLDVAWYELIARLNRADPPEVLKAVRAMARPSYGWTEFIDHIGCDAAGCALFFRRAGAWLALLHAFVATDMHQENMIAAGEHPVPIDLETILQPSAEEHKAHDAEGEAFDAAMDIVGNSVMTVGLLPAYGRSIDNNVFAMGGMTADWNLRTVLTWTNINSDAMRPAKAKEHGATTPNLPHIDGRYARLTDHIESFVAGFEDYAEFLLHYASAATPATVFDGFAGLPVRKVVRPTRFYYMLLQRLKDHRTMHDGAIWSAQADFIARLAEWDKDADPLWPLQRAERSALLTLNVPHFVSPSDGDEISDAAGIAVHTAATSGLERAVARLQNFNEAEIAWQTEVIRENTKQTVPAAAPALPMADEKAVTKAQAKAIPRSDAAIARAPEIFHAEADRIAAELSRLAIRRGPGAAWIGLDWLGDSDVFQLVCLGPDLYNGATGIAVFLAAHAAVTGSKLSGEVALAGLSHLRHNLQSRNAARMARSLGIGGATGLGSIVYAFAVMAKFLNDADLLVDAHHAAQLFTDELIAADKQLDVMGGSAGAILALLRLYRDSSSAVVLARATKCGEHLLSQRRLGPEGSSSWVGQGSGTRGLNGMSHGAAGFAYALTALAAATGRAEFAQAAAECMAFENSSYDAARHNWPDLRGSGEPLWSCQWCHGASGIGLARIAMAKRSGMDAKPAAVTPLVTDIRNALAGVEQTSPLPVDTLCCGTLGSVEFFCEAAGALERGDLRDLAARRLMTVLDRAAATGDYRWNSGKRQFNLGLFRGLAGIGYTLLRQIDASLPNVIIWE